MTETTATPLRESEAISDTLEDVSESGGSVSPRRRRWPWIASGLIVLAGAILGIQALADGSGSETETGPVVLNTAEVVMTDLVELTTLDGTLGREAGDAVGSVRGGTITALPAAGDVISSGEVLFEINDEPVMLLTGSMPVYRDLTLNDEIALSTDLNGTITWLPEEGATIEQGDVLFQIDDEPVVLLAGSMPAYRDMALATVDVDVPTGLAGAITWLPEEGATIEQGDVLFEIDDEPVVLLYGDTPATRTMEDLDTNLEGDDVLQLEEALVDLGFATDDELAVDGEFTSGTAEIVAGWQEAIGAEADGIVDVGEVVFLPGPIEIVTLEAEVDAEAADGDVVLAATGTASISGDDVRQLEEALVDLGYATEDDLVVDQEFTTDTADAVAAWQEAIGAEADGIVDMGEVAFLPESIEVLDIQSRVGDITGATPLWIGIGPGGMSGVDVAQLEDALVALGYDADGTMAADGVMSSETVSAIVAWQDATGQEIDGVVDIGDVVFIDGAVRISDIVTPLGATANPGAPILQTTGNDVSVTVELPAEDQGIIATGDPVTVELPDGTRTAGTVLEVATVATTAVDGSTIFEVSIALDDPSAAGDLDEAPVDVDVVTDSVSNVVAVPVTSLLGLREGGYAVEVHNGDGSTTLVLVDPGFFADGLVEVDGSDLQPGMQVVIP